LWLLFGSVTSAMAQVSIGIGPNLPGVSIGINLPAYPELVLVPGYPVYCAPRLQANFFFYGGLHWVYQADAWYASSWYNGPWGLATPEVVPLFVPIPVPYATIGILLGTSVGGRRMRRPAGTSTGAWEQRRPAPVFRG
jgi:hypothetical protein